MRLGYSTLGAPEFSLAQCEALAGEFGLDFLELRALEGHTDLPALFEERAAEPVRIALRMLGSSLRLTEASSADVEAFYGYAALAHRLHIPYLRVFGGGRVGDGVSAAQLARAAECVERVRGEMRARGWKGEILLETHDAFSIPEACLELNRRISKPLNLLWDSHHTWRFGGETPAETWRKIGPLVRHVHYKDSVAEGRQLRYVLPGDGEFPHAALFEVLHTHAYLGGVSLEWEKLWHPELPPLRDALESFARIAGRNATPGCIRHS